MDKFLIEGGRPLNGEVLVSGSKNAALPVLCTALLTDDTCIYHNVPKLNDIHTMLKVLDTMGLKSTWNEGSTVTIDPGLNRVCEAPYDLVKSMRASILVLGPLLAKNKRAKVSLPGGCAIGARPVDLHLKALTKMGAEIELSHGYVVARTAGLKGARIVFDKVTVGGTENILMAAALAEGTTIIEGAAREPEIVDLANALIEMGAQIEGAGESRIVIEGVKELRGAEHSIIPDRIEAGTFMVAAPITKGVLTLNGACYEHVASTADKLEEMGVSVTVNQQGQITVDGRGELKPVEIETVPYPGFPTDMQAQFMALAAVAGGVSTIHERIFENRFMHVPELMRLGASLDEHGPTVVVKGIKQFEGASVMATDLRASACLVLAALNAHGTTEIRRIYHLDRGYEHLDRKLNAVGAHVERVKGDL